MLLDQTEMIYEICSPVSNPSVLSYDLEFRCVLLWLVIESCCGETNLAERELSVKDRFDYHLHILSMLTVAQIPAKSSELLPRWVPPWSVCMDLVNKKKYFWKTKPNLKSDLIRKVLVEYEEIIVLK